ncbi:MAG: tetratricopeptide repeat protein [Chitinispirillaceae bacterium]|nr:tetratricopeptide repeat protein [Chitinispirillaceae bacterium]
MRLVLPVLVIFSLAVSQTFDYDSPEAGPAYESDAPGYGASGDSLGFGVSGDSGATGWDTYSDSAPSGFDAGPVSYAAPVVHIAYPIDAGQKRRWKKTLWLAALLDAAARFRLEFCADFGTITGKELSRYVPPDLKKLANDPFAPDYSLAIRDHNATHQLVQKFELGRNQDVFTLFLELIDLQTGNTVMTLDRKCHVNYLGILLDTCYFAVASRISGREVSSQTRRFFARPSLFASYKSNNKLGKLVYKESYTRKKKVRNASRKYEKLLKSEKEPLFVLWRFGNASYKDERYDKALSSYRTINTLAPDNEVSALAIARTCLKKKDPQTAKFQLSPIVASKGKPLREVHELLGDAHLMTGDSATALDQYRKERELYGGGSPLQEKIASLCFSLKRMNEAKDEYQRLLEIDPTNPRVRYYLGYLMLIAGTIAQADAFLIEAKAYGDDAAFLWEPIGDAYVKSGKWKQARQAYETALSFDKKQSRLVKKLATTALREGNDSAAAEYYLDLYKADPRENAPSLAEAGKLFAKKKMWDRAADAFDRYLKEGYTDYEVTLAYARIMFQRKEWKKVIDLLGIHATSATATEEVLFMLAESWFATGRYKDAEPVLTRLNAMRPGDPRVMRMLALAAEETGDLVKATTLYEKYMVLSKQEKQTKDIAFHLGELYEKQKQRGNAIGRYELNTRTFPSDIRNYERLLEFYSEGKKLSLLRRTLENAIANAKAPASMHRDLARVYAKLDEHQLAVQAYQTYLGREERDAEAWKELGTLYYNVRQYKNAIPPLNRAADRLSRDFDCYYMLGYSYLQRDMHDSARTAFERAHSLKRRDTVTIKHLAHCYRTLGQKDPLIGLLNRWSALEPKRSDILVELGRLYLKKERPKNAVKVLEDAVKLNPYDRPSHWLLGEAHAKLGNDSLSRYHKQRGR